MAVIWSYDGRNAKGSTTFCVIFADHLEAIVVNKVCTKYKLNGDEMIINGEYCVLPLNMDFFY
jgi:hypothetical protein